MTDTIPHLAPAPGTSQVHRRVKLNPRSVGQLLRGVPAALLEEVASEDGYGLAPQPAWWAARVARSRRKRAKQRRDAMINRIVTRRGWFDHGRVYAAGGKVVALTGSPYHLSLDDLAEVRFICDLWGLTLTIGGESEYSPRCVRIEIRRPGAPSTIGGGH